MVTTGLQRSTMFSTRTPAGAEYPPTGMLHTKPEMPTTTTPRRSDHSLQALESGLPSGATRNNTGIGLPSATADGTTTVQVICSREVFSSWTPGINQSAAGKHAANIIHISALHVCIG